MSQRSRRVVFGSIVILIATMAWAPAVVAAPPTPRSARRAPTQHQEAARVRHARGRPRAPGRAPGDRRRQRRDAGGGHAGLRGERRLRRRADDGRRLQRHAQQLPVRLRPAVRRCEQLTPVAATYETGAFTGSGFRRCHRRRRADRHQPRPAAANTSGCDGAFTEAARRRPARCGSWRCRRLRRLPGGRDRPDPARRLQLRPQGVQRQCCRCRRRHHLQPGRHAAARSPHRRYRRATAAFPVRAHHPRRRRVVRQRCGPRRTGLDRAHHRPTGAEHHAQ